MTKEQIEAERVRFEKYWKSKPSYKDSDKEAELRGWLAAKQDAAGNKNGAEEHY